MGFDDIAMYRPVFAIELIVLAMAAMVVGTLWLYARRASPAGIFRRGVLVGLRLGALAALAWVLLGPSVMRSSQLRSQRQAVTILLDASASMAVRDAGEDEQGKAVSRWRAVVDTWLTDENLAQLRELADVRVYQFSGELSPMQTDTQALEPVGDQTQLWASLHQAVQDPFVSGQPGQAVVLLSDGHDTNIASDARVIEQLKQRRLTVFAVPVGQGRSEPDVAVQAWTAGDFVFDGQATTISAALHHRGYVGRRVRVELLEDGRRIESQSITLSSAATNQLAFRVEPTPPTRNQVEVRSYTVRAQLYEPAEGESSLADEATLKNNEQAVFVQVSREHVKVLLFEGEPYWETRFLAQLLRKDPHVRLTALYHFGRDRRVVLSEAGAEALDPERLDAATLNEFDVIVLGKSVERFLPAEQAQRLVDFVRQRGGALVLARGEPFGSDDAAGRDAMKLIEQISPVSWGRQTLSKLGLTLTQAGRQSPLFRFEDLDTADAVVTQLPGMLAATRVEREKAASVVLLTQHASAADAGDRQAMAAVTTMQAGRGRVMAVLADGLWQWALLPTELSRLEPVYAMFWSRAVRWLATGGAFLPGQEVSLTLDRLTAVPGEPVQVTVALRYVQAGAFRPRVRITGPDGQTQMLEPTRQDPRSPQYHATFYPKRAGIHRVELIDDGGAGVVDPQAVPSSRFAVVDSTREQFDTSPRPGVLETLTQATGGRCLPADQPESLLAHLNEVRQARQADPQAGYDFARWQVFVIIAGCLALEWLIRRRGGLI